MRNTTMTVVIAASVVLAAVIVTRTPAQVESGVGACCYGAAGCYVTGTGVVDCLQGGGTWIDGGTCVECPPPPGPTVVGGAALFANQTNNNSVKLYRFWSDGEVDHLVAYHGDGLFCTPTLSCPPFTIVPGTCPTDINRDGDTGIQDFLTLLGGWGACGG